MMLVTHDVKVASKCSRIMYIEDGNIKGELRLDEPLDSEKDIKDRRRKVNNWLSDMGW